MWGDPGVGKYEYDLLSFNNLSNRALYAIDEASIIQPSKDDQNICEQYDKSKATDSEKEGSENQPNDLNLL